jgi:hypothetical protein
MVHITGSPESCLPGACAPVQSVDRAGLGVSWGVPFIVAAVAMIVAGIVIGFYTIKGERSNTAAVKHMSCWCGRSPPACWMALDPWGGCCCRPGTASYSIGVACVFWVLDGG